MNITLSEQLKKLRRDKGNTQEELASLLGLSVQAVSKWERNEGYPDITLLPAISAYYNVSVDELLGVDELKKQAEIDEYIQKSTVLANQGRTAERVALWREAYRDHSNDINVIYRLMYALLSNDNPQDYEEIIALGERVLKECDVPELRMGAIQCACFACIGLNRTDDAQKYAAMASSYYSCRNELMKNLLKGEEAVRCCQQNLQMLIDLVSLNVSAMLQNANFTASEKIKAYAFVLKLYDLLYDDGNYGFYSIRVSEWNMWLAELYAEESQWDSTLDCLEKAVQCAILYDTATGGSYTSLLTDRCVYDPAATSKNYTESTSMLRLQEMRYACFDFLRENERFQKIERRLKAAAKSN